MIMNNITSNRGDLIGVGEVVNEEVDGGRPRVERLHEEGPPLRLHHFLLRLAQLQRQL